MEHPGAERLAGSRGVRSEELVAEWRGDVSDRIPIYRDPDGEPPEYRCCDTASELRAWRYPHPPDPGPSLWFNPKAFQFANLQFGSVGRNTLRQPGIKTWDIGLFKEFPVREVQRFQFRMEAFNLYNTPQFSAPNAQFGAPGFGQMTSTWLANRQVQFGLKYLF